MLLSRWKSVVLQVALSGAVVATRAWAQVPGAVPSSPTEVGTALWRGMQVHYVMRNGHPTWQGDIILDNLVFGPVSIGASRREQPASTPSRESPRTLGVIYSSSLWPNVGGIYQIPYIITNGSANLNTAIADYNTTFSGLIQWVARTNQTDYVNFYLDPTNECGCGESYFGRIGGEQTTNCAINCSVGTLVHEMGHDTGLWHEQSRPDRGAYVTLNYNHIQATDVSNNNNIAANNAWIYGPYDYASIMEYGGFADTADGSETIQTIPAGIPLDNGNYYTTADIDTIRRLYSAAPSSVTIDTNPTGLRVIVDGITITTPQAYASWALNSNHTLAIPAGLSSSGLQSLGGLYYQFGRWNDDGAASHTLTVTPGNGLPGYSPSSPAQTVYTANFIQWFPFSPNTNGSSPPGAGTLTTNPAPTTFAGVGQLFMADHYVAFSANASAGYNFIQWYGSGGSYYCGFSCSFHANPLIVLNSTTPNIEPGFTTSQVTTVTTNPPGLPVQVDGTTYTSPASFSPAPNINGSAWASGTTHTVSVTSPQNPLSPNTSYVWSNWSDGLAQSHQFTVASGNSTITANYNTQVGLVLATNSGNNCAGSVAANPPGPSNLGTSVTFTATPSSGFVFAQWEGALSGSTNPYTGPVNQEEFVQADFNTVSGPLTIASLSPATVTAGAAPFTLTINGTGFTPPPGASGNSAGYAFVYANGIYSYRVISYISPTQVQISILAADIANPGAIEIQVDNRVNDSCEVTANAQLVISQALTTQYQLTISASPAAGGTVSPVTGTFYSAGTVVPITAAANVGYVFGGWSGNVASASNTSTTVTMSGTQTVVANFTGSGAQPISVSPASGSAGRQVFNFVSRNTLGVNSIQYTQFLYSKSGINALNACYISYDPTANVFYLLSDDTTQWYGLLAGSGNNIGNAQCTIHGATSGSTKSGTDLTTNVDISFRSGFAGLKNIYQFSGDTMGNGSGWQPMGTWSDAGDPNLVEIVSLTPNSGGGLSQTFTAVVKEGGGGNTIAFAQYVMNAGLNGFNACFIHYDRASNVFYLLNNAGTGWFGLIAGSATQVQNSQCILQGVGSGGTVAGTNLTITYNLSFTGSFTGARQIYMQAVDQANTVEVWHQVANWTP
jgi:hypothetical protein